MTPRTLAKVPAVGILIGTFIASAFLGSLIFGRSPKKRSFLCQNAAFFARLLARLLGIHVSGATSLQALRGHFIVSNHVSYVDAIALASRLPCVFITSVEVRNQFFLGLMAELAGCLFVERRSRTALQTEINEIASVLEGGLNVVLFPEGTSTDGSKVLPFKKSLFRARAMSRAPVVPITLNYREVDGVPFSSSNRDRVFYYGSIEFGSQFLELIACKRVDIQILRGLALGDHLDHRKTAEEAHDQVERRHSPIGLALSY